MEKNRQTKIISIIALVIAVIGMSLGFAAFSNILTISSSATVTPNSEDFKIKVYGFVGDTYADTSNEAMYTSETSIDALYLSESETVIKNAANINNNTLTISGINTAFTAPGESAVYMVKILNDGAYDAYFDLSQIKGYNPLVCTPATDTTQSLVDSACTGINSVIMLYTFEALEAYEKYENGEITYDEYQSIVSNGWFEPGMTYDIKTFKLEKNESMLLMMEVDYLSNAARADGPFTATFEDIKLEFSSRDPNLSE